MAQRNSSSMDIHFLRINLQHFNVGQYNHTECFIYFPHGNVFLFQSCIFKNLKINFRWLSRYLAINLFLLFSGILQFWFIFPLDVVSYLNRKGFSFLFERVCFQILLFSLYYNQNFVFHALWCLLFRDTEIFM